MPLILYFPFVISIMMILLTGCEQDLDLDKYKNRDIEQMLVVNSILNPDSVMGVSVTHPYFFSDTHVSFNPVECLEIQIDGDNGRCEWLRYDKKTGLYVSKYKPVAGEILNLRIENSSGRTVYSRDTIPHNVVIDHVELTGEGPIHIYWDNDYRFTYKITFCDPKGDDNYYFLAIEDDAAIGVFSQMGEMDYTSDYVFQELANIINQDIQGWRPDGVFGYPFSDKGIDGEKYTITVTEVLQQPLVSLIENLPRKIKLYSISKSYFNYMVSLLSSDYDKSALKGNFLSLGLLEPVKIYSNIEGGAGLMGSYNLTIMRVDLLEMSGGWPTK